MLPARSLRQAQADDTRARLFAAAAGLFATQGYHETTVDQIAREAGVAKGTFFVHFTTKDAVITELVGKQVRAARRAREHEQGTPVDRLRAAVLALGDQAGVSRGLSRAVLSATLANEFTEAVGDLYLSSLFALGFILFVITFIVLALAKLMLIRLAKQAGT